MWRAAWADRMFIVARRRGQRLFIGNDIEIVVTDLSRTTVKLGVVAPKPCSILRGEVRDSIAEANLAAVRSDLEKIDQDGSTGAPPILDATLAGASAFLGRSVNVLTPKPVKPKTSG